MWKTDSPIYKTEVKQYHAQTAFFFLYLWIKKNTIYDIYLANDHFIVWPSSLTLTLTLTLNLPTQMFQMNNCANFFFKSMLKYRSYGQDTLNLWPISHLTFKTDLELQPTWTNVLNGTSTPEGQQLCQIILKSIHKCTTYGLDKLCLWPFYHLTVKCNLETQPTWTNSSNGTSTLTRTTTEPKYFKIHVYSDKDKNCAKLFWNPCINVQVMAQTSSICEHFIIWLSSVTLTSNLPEQMF